MPDYQAPLACAILVVTIAVLRYLVRSRTGKKYPPGPPGIPLMGNILSLSPEAVWEKLAEYRHIYGDILMFYGFGSHILVISSMDVIRELFDTRAAVNSDRPMSVSTHELMGLGRSFVMMPYCEEWKSQRKLVRRGLSSDAVKQYHSVQGNLAAALSDQLLQTPEHFIGHIRRTASRIVVAVAYGLSTKQAEDEYIPLAESTLDMISESTIPGTFLCDFIPVKYLPRYMNFHRQTAKIKVMFEEMVTKPVEHVKRQIEINNAPRSLLNDLLSLPSVDTEEYERTVTWATGSLFGAGGETTYAVVLTFVLAMVLNPDKQRLAQQELDKAIGEETLPSILHRDDLRYLDAVVKETLRWHPPLPIGLPHCTATDDVYHGYNIPKRTIIIPNIWVISREERGLYAADEFAPERFLAKEPPLDPNSYVFGFGRRLCPGKALGENSLFIIIATLLACFDILPPTNGGLPTPKWSTGAVSYPLPFECRFVPRSSARLALVKERASQVNRVVV